MGGGHFYSGDCFSIFVMFHFFLPLSGGGGGVFFWVLFFAFCLVPLLSFSLWGLGRRGGCIVSKRSAGSVHQFHGLFNLPPNILPPPSPSCRRLGLPPPAARAYLSVGLRVEDVEGDLVHLLQLAVQQLQRHWSRHARHPATHTRLID